MGSPPPTSQRSSTEPFFGGADATTVVTKWKSGPSWSRAAAATSSFWVDAGARAWPAARLYTFVGPSSITRQLPTPVRAASRRAARRPLASVGGAGTTSWRAVVGGAVGGGAGAAVVVSTTVVTVVGNGGTDRISALPWDDPLRPRTLAAEITSWSAMRPAIARTTQGARPPPTG